MAQETPIIIKVDVTDAAQELLKRGIPLKKAKDLIRAYFEMECLEVVDWGDYAEGIAKFFKRGRRCESNEHLPLPRLGH